MTTNTKKEDIIFQDYNEFWNNNLQKIEEIQNKLNKSLGAIENQYMELNKLFDIFTEEINVLASIYSNFNSIEGKDYILKLKSIGASYKKRFQEEEIDLKTIYFLIEKINKLRDESFENFPIITHLDEEEKKEKFKGNLNSNYEGRPFKWITFQRNGSFFIIKFSQVDIIDKNQFKKITKEDNRLYITTEDKNYNPIDFFPKENNSDAELIIEINNDTSFLADKLGKKIYSRRDFIFTKIEPFKQKLSNNPFYGKVKIFGKNHLFIKKEIQ